MDGKRRCLDNIFVERLWRSLKYEHVCLHVYDDLNLLELGTDLRTVQILLCHRSLSSTTRYTHLTEARRLVLRSPLEALSTEQGSVLG